MRNAYAIPILMEMAKIVMVFKLIKYFLRLKHFQTKNKKECGKTFFENNAIDGGISAVPHSWPATVDILFFYRATVYVGQEEYLTFHTSNCAGTLINRKSILTTAGCIKTSFVHIIANVSYTVNVTFNDFHPDYQSMYTVYVGAHNQINLFSNIAPAKHVLVEDIIIVNF